MNAELWIEAEEEALSEIAELVRLCNEADGTEYDCMLDGDFYYVIRNEDRQESGAETALLSVLSGFRLGETENGREILELTAFTHPSLRGQGFFTLCYNSLRDDFRGFCLRFSVKPVRSAGEEKRTVQEEQEARLCPDTEETLRALSARLLREELFMEKQLPVGIANPGDSLSREYGELHLTGYSKDTLYLYGLLVYDRYLGQGYGRALMESVESFPEKGRYRRILLQVSSENRVALGLYRSMGYRVTERICYYEPGGNENGKGL